MTGQPSLYPLPSSLSGTTPSELGGRRVEGVDELASCTVSPNSGVSCRM